MASNRNKIKYSYIMCTMECLLKKQSDSLRGSVLKYIYALLAKTVPKKCDQICIKYIYQLYHN